MRSRRRVLPATLLALALAEAAASGCGGARREPAPPFRLQEQLARSSARAQARGDLAGAIAEQERALLAARSVEDDEGIALRALDLAALHRAAGQPLQARAALEELLAEPPPMPYPGRWRAEAARLAGLLALDAGDPAAGARWAARARALCEAARCPERGAIVNLQARAAFFAGDFTAAATLAGEARGLNRDARDGGEEANSLRVAADAALAEGRHETAADHYASALELDKRLGLAGKVFLDLIGLGRAAEAGGDPDTARRWYERARAAALAAGDAAGAAEAAARLP